MTLHFDKWGRLETPTISLCSASSYIVNGSPSNLIGRVNTKALSGDLNFNANSVMSFEVPKENQDPAVYDRIKTRMYVFIEDIGYFIITSCEDFRDATGQESKQVSITSAEKELSRCEAPYLDDGLYYIYGNDPNKKYIIAESQSVASKWQFDVSHIPTDYPGYGNVARYLADVEYDNLYSFLMECVQERFDCFFEFDIINRTIRMYAKTAYADNFETDIHLSDVNVIKEFHKTADDEDTFTAMKVSGGNGLDIRRVNPLGTNIIYDFTDRLEEMSSSLKSAVQAWSSAVSTASSYYLAASLLYAQKQDALASANLDLINAQGVYDNLIITQNTAIESGDSSAISTAKANVAEALSEVNTAKAAVAVANANVQSALAAVEAIQTPLKLAVGTYFTADNLKELSAYIVTGEFTDENIAITDNMTYEEQYDAAKQLLDEATEQMQKYATNNYKFEITTEDLLYNRHFEYFAKQLKPGVVVWAESEPDHFEQFHVSAIHFENDTKTSSLTFSSKYNKYDIQSLFDETLGSVNKSASQVARLVDVITDHQKALEDSKTAIDQMMTLTSYHVLASTNQNVIINEDGYWGRKYLFDDPLSGEPLYEQEQVRIINSGIYITDDNWETVKAALGKYEYGRDENDQPLYVYGVLGDVIVGKLIIGEKLMIDAKDSNGSSVTTIDGGGLKVYSGEIEVYTSPYGATGTNIHKAIYTEDGNLVVDGTIYANDGSIGGWEITADSLKYDHSGSPCAIICPAGTEASDIALAIGCTYQAPWANAPFTVDVYGKLKATSGEIGGWTITSSSLKYDNDGEPCSVFCPTGAGYYDIALAIGCEYGNTWETSPFTVDIDGKLKCTSGTIGGWTITDGVLSATTFNDHITGMQSYCNASGTSTAFCAGATNNDNWTTAPFYVRHDGYLHATNVYVEGEISASSGNFANGCTFGGTDAARMRVNSHTIQTSTTGLTSQTVYGFFSNATGGWCSVIGVDASGNVWIGQFNSGTNQFTGVLCRNGLTHRYATGTEVAW